MTSNDENCLILLQLPKLNPIGGSGHAPREIMKFRSSEIVRNSNFPIYFQESLIKNWSKLADKLSDLPTISKLGGGELSSPVPPQFLPLTLSKCILTAIVSELLNQSINTLVIDLVY